MKRENAITDNVDFDKLVLSIKKIKLAKQGSSVRKDGEFPKPLLRFPGLEKNYFRELTLTL